MLALYVKRLEFEPRNRQECDLRKLYENIQISDRLLYNQQGMEDDTLFDGTIFVGTLEKVTRNLAQSIDIEAERGRHEFLESCLKFRKRLPKMGATAAEKLTQTPRFVFLGNLRFNSDHEVCAHSQRTNVARLNCAEILGLFPRRCNECHTVHHRNESQSFGTLVVINHGFRPHCRSTVTHAPLRSMKSKKPSLDRKILIKVIEYLIAICVGCSRAYRLIEPIKVRIASRMADRKDKDVTSSSTSSEREVGVSADVKWSAPPIRLEETLRWLSRISRYFDGMEYEKKTRTTNNACTNLIQRFRYH
ncbi:hypothetical protein CLF_108261 [Clonorchis sinensis]|uniref:Uncharacterized protein n=1 Tax=Clonorchis sinensis TaxID=79923 RepID=G7YRF7_CLOSI|nr:hypothetical protein CLF_108261 [Clonorchis sinensis]